MTARLVPLTEGSIAILLDKAITLIGRHPECDAVLDENQKISRRHCCIAQVDNRLVLRDLGSMNGIRVNGEQIVEVDLQEGDEVTIGDEEFVIELNYKPGKDKKRSSTDLPTPEKPKRSPKPSSTSTPRNPELPVDISQEFPVAIPDESLPDQLRPAMTDKASEIKRISKSIKKKSADDSRSSKKNEKSVYKLDSGEIELGGFGDV